MGSGSCSPADSRRSAENRGSRNSSPASASDTPTQHALAPVAAIDSTHITLGPLGKKKKVSGELVLRNTGRTPLVISALQVYNPGISVSIGKRRIDPGQAEKLKITVHANNKYFKGRRRILLITNDPDHSKMVIDVEVLGA